MNNYREWQWHNDQERLEANNKEQEHEETFEPAEIPTLLSECRYLSLDGQHEFIKTVLQSFQQWAGDSRNAYILQRQSYKEAKVFFDTYEPKPENPADSVEIRVNGFEAVVSGSCGGGFLSIYKEGRVSLMFEILDIDQVWSLIFSLTIY